MAMEDGIELPGGEVVSDNSVADALLGLSNLTSEERAAVLQDAPSGRVRGEILDKARTEGLVFRTSDALRHEMADIIPALLNADGSWSEFAQQLQREVQESSSEDTPPPGESREAQE